MTTVTISSGIAQGFRDQADQA